MSSLTERLQEARAKAKPTFEQWFAGLDEDDRVELVGALGDQHLATRNLIAIIRAQGISVGEERFKEIRLSHGYVG